MDFHPTSSRSFADACATARAGEAKRSLAGLARRTLAYWASLGILVLAACNYSFAGGTFPSHINTVYIEPFENPTERFDIEQ